MTQENSRRAQDNGEVSNSFKRLLYRPYGKLVVVPFFLANTALSGTVAAVVARLLGQNPGFHLGTLWGWLTCKANFTNVVLTGREHIDPNQSYVIMSNHQSHFDILAFYGAWRRQFRWVMKQELRKVPVLGWACEHIGHVFIDRSDREKAIASLAAAREQLVDGVSIMFFPEGTRSRDGRIRDFKKGGFMMALDLGLPILPVSISGSYKVLPEGTFDPFPGRIDITVHAPIDVAEYGVERRDALIADTRQAVMQGLTPYERGE